MANPVWGNWQSMHAIINQRKHFNASRIETHKRGYGSIAPLEGNWAAHSGRAIAKAQIESSIPIKRVVGARGFEPPTPCAQGSEQKCISLARIAFLCVIEHGFIR